MKKRLVALTLTAAMVAGMTACGSNGGSSTETGSASGSSSGNGDVSITIFNSKVEVQDQFIEMAEQYSEQTGVDVEIYYSSDTVATHLATKYAEGDPYTISMVDAKDIYSMGAEYAADLGSESWVGNTDYAITVGDKLCGFPVCIEARGVMYNADAIEAITGETFDPTAYATLDDFTALLDELVAGGMTSPVAIMKEDWSLAAHYLAQVYEEQEDPEAFVSALYEGTADLANNEKYNSLMDTFDTLKKYNVASAAPIAAEREVLEQQLAEGEVAFMFGGNWDWSMINVYDYTENMGMMPVPQNTNDGSNKKLVGGGSKYFFIDDSENTTDEERQAAKDFLNWLVNDEAGNKFLTETCALVPAFSNIDASALDPLSSSVKSFADAGNLIGNYNYCPDDHITIAGGHMQEFLAGQVDKAGLAEELETYFQGATPIEH